MPIDRDIENHIKSDQLKSLKDYKIRDLVKHAQEFGPFLKNQKLETNQVRKFLDAINRLKVKIAQNADQSQKDIEKNNQTVFSKIEPEIVLLKPKLAYAAARQNAAKPLSNVMSVAIRINHCLP